MSTLNNCGTGYFNGFVSGPNAANAGVSYTANNNSVYGNFGGAATFAQSSSAATPATTVVDQYPASSMEVRLVSPTVFNTFGFSNTPQNTAYVNTTFYASGEGSSFNFTGQQLTGIISTRDPGAALTKTASSAPSFGSVGSVADADFIGWGAWAQATGTNNSSGNGFGGGSGSGAANASQLIDYIHYVAGRPTPSAQMPVTGTANYGLVGGTAPTATLGGVTQTGQLVSGSLSVNFATGFMGVDIGTKFGTTAVNISVAQSTTGNYSTTTVSRSGSSFYSNGCGNTAISGFFSGDLAYRAGLTYRSFSNTVGTINGAAAFQRTSASGVGVSGGGGSCGTFC